MNIEPQPDLFRRFEIERPDDINLQLAVGTNPGHRQLFIPEYGPSMASFEIARASMLGSPLHSIEVEVKPLAAVFDAHLPKGSGIDFLNVDAEGSDLDVLNSNNWEKYRPRVVCVEMTVSEQAGVVDLFSTHEYRTVATNSIIIGEVIELFAVDSRLDWKAVL